MQKWILGLAVAVSLAGCSASKDVASAEGGIATFHQQLNAGQFDAIYVGSGDELKRVTTQTSWEQLLTAIHRKLGPFQSGKSAGWNDNVTTNGHFVTLRYTSTYQRGAAEENFVYRVDGEQPRLVGYHVNSTALILN